MSLAAPRLYSGFAISKNPAEIYPAGFLFWRRPTLARPIAVLPSGRQRFTAVFGMGTGGATALLSPDSVTGVAVRRHRGEIGRYRSLETCVPRSTSTAATLDFKRTINYQLSHLATDSLISTYRKFRNSNLV